MLLVLAVFELKLVVLDEGVLVGKVFVETAEIPPEATNKVGDNYCNDNQSENLVDVEQHVLGHNFFITG